MTVARGFATWDKEKLRAVCSKAGRTNVSGPNRHRFTSDEARAGGTKAQATGRAHRFTPEEARAASLKGHAERLRLAAERDYPGQKTFKVEKHAGVVTLQAVVAEYGIPEEWLKTLPVGVEMVVQSLLLTIRRIS